MSEEQIPQDKIADWMAWPQLARTAMIGAGVGGIMLGLILGYSMGFDYGKKSAVSYYTPPATPAAADSAVSSSNLVFGKWHKNSGSCPDYLTLSLSDGKLSYLSGSSADSGGTEYKEEIQGFTDSSVTTHSGSSTFLYSVSGSVLTYSFTGSSCSFDRLN